MADQDLLEPLRDSSTVRPSLSAAEVRRRGDRLRRRRHGLQALAAAAAVVTVVTAVTAGGAGLLDRSHLPGPAAPARVLGPDGLGSLRLGQSRDEVEEAGGVIGEETLDGCYGVSLEGTPEPYVAGFAEGGGLESGGLASIEASPGTSTPEGIAIGAGRAEVQAAYPAVRRVSSTLWIAKASPTADYHLWFQQDEVSRVSLTLRGSPCDEAVGSVVAYPAEVVTATR